MSTHDDTTPAGVFRLLRRLLESHQRADSHDNERCPLCQDTERTIGLLAEQLPDIDFACPGCCAEPGDAHADTCPGSDGRCPGCGALPETYHQQYCPVGRSSSVFRLSDIGYPTHHQR